MLAVVNRCRPAIHAGLAALVVLALSHCSWEDARELAQRSRTVVLHRLGLPTPIQKPVHDCGHESGCICRGATIVLAIGVMDWQAQPVELLPVDFCCLPASYVADDSAAGKTLDDRQNFPPPLFGRQLRARYASLVI